MPQKTLPDISPWPLAAVLVAITVLQYLSVNVSPAILGWFFEGELGLVENLQVILLCATLFLVVLLFAKARINLLKGYLALLACALVWLLGEEISWGQHFLGWSAEGWFASNNDQLETNLHNTSSWLDQKPRILLLAGIILGGIIHPLQVRQKGRGMFSKLPFWLPPTSACLPLALLVVVVMPMQPLDNLGILPFRFDVVRTSELQELYMYGFMLVYMLSLRIRLAASKKA